VTCVGVGVGVRVRVRVRACVRACPSESYRSGNSCFFFSPQFAFCQKFSAATVSFDELGNAFP